MKSIIPRCGDCQFWEEIVKVDGETMGECHLNPPVHVYVPGAGQGPDIFPRVEEDDWCGQFKERWS